jgi:hypothetical protein
MTAQLSVPFEMMCAGLQRFTMQPFYQMMNALTTVTNQVGLVIFARESGLSKKAELASLVCSISDQAYTETLLNLLCGEIPLDFQMMYDQMEEGIYLCPELLGGNYFSFDEMEELFADPLGFDAEISLMAFLLWFSYNHDLAVYQEMNEHFGWPEDPPECEGDNLDPKKLRKALHKRRLDCLYSAADASWNLSGNVFFGWMPYDGSEMIELTIENYRWLKREYKRAKPVMEGMAKANELVLNDPGVYRELFAAMVEASSG